ncbi:MAG: helix-turn-helix transcriptional regulator [Actinomycetota bacterium]
MSPRALAGSEVQRILALVPWLVAHPGAPKSEIAQRFGIDRARLDEDLALVLMIGTPPYSPGDYLDVIDDGESVTIRLAEHFRKALRLNPAEGLALLAAGTALLAVPGSDPSGPLATALEKLERALDLPDLVVEVGEPPLLGAVRNAAGRHERIEIEYWSAGRDELTQRRVDPTVVFFALGAWYVGAYCHRAEGERMFRVDRIRAVHETGEQFVPSESGFEAGEVYNPAADDPRITLRLAPAAAWVAEQYPTLSVTERADGALDVVLVVSEPAWLDRLLLRLGPDVSVLDPPALVDAGAAAAARVLARYTGKSHKPSEAPRTRRPESAGT